VDEYLLYYLLVACVNLQEELDIIVFIRSNYVKGWLINETAKSSKQTLLMRLLIYRLMLA
jgi:hypothetical protein